MRAMGKHDARPVRSLLYTPGDQEQRIAENVKSGADALFLVDPADPRELALDLIARRARHEFDLPPIVLVDLDRLLAGLRRTLGDETL